MQTFGIGLILSLLMGGFYFLSEVPLVTQYFKGSIGEMTHNRQPKEEVEPLQQNILFTGDVFLGRNVERLIELYGADYPFRNLVSVFDAHFYQVANFEGSIPEVHTPTQDLTFQFSVSELQLAEFKNAQFSHVSLANNHSYDFGVSGYEHTVHTLQAADISTFGKPYAFSSSSSTYIEVNDTSIALIGLDLTVADYSAEELAELFEYVNSQSEFQIAYVHWGTEYAPVHSASQERYAKLLIEYGADLIVGHHPHVVQDIGQYKNVLIFYSLGNFIFDQYFSNEVQEGLLLSLTFDEEMSVSLLPISSVHSRISPRIMTGFEKDVFLKKLAKRSDSSISEGILAGYIAVNSDVAVSP